MAYGLYVTTTYGRFTYQDFLSRPILGLRILIPSTSPRRRIRDVSPIRVVHRAGWLCAPAGSVRLLALCACWRDRFCAGFDHGAATVPALSVPLEPAPSSAMMDSRWPAAGEET